MAVVSTSGTTPVATPVPVTLTAPYNSLRVYNRGTVELWVRTDGTAAAVGADENQVVPAGKDDVFRVALDANYDQGSGSPAPTTSVVSLAASAACPYTVVGQG